MNKRIRELKEQATTIEVLSGRGFDTTQYTERFSKEKFAELIVKECVAICEDTEGDPSADSRWGRRCCALEIKQHFGVEE